MKTIIMKEPTYCAAVKTGSESAPKELLHRDL